MIYIGIDPGKKGGVATISEGGVKVYQWEDRRFIEDMRQHANWLDKCVAAVEKVGAFSGQGVKSMFNFGMEYGFIQGVLSAFGIPYQLVPPATWKREFTLIGKDKKASIDVCRKLFPGMSLLPTERCRKESDGMAESLLIAEYARRKM